MKKSYLKPAMTVIQISPQEILYGSVNGNFKKTETQNVDIYFDDDKTINGEDAW